VAYVELCTEWREIPDVCNLPAEHPLHDGTPWHDMFGAVANVDCEYEADYIDEEIGWRSYCHHHEFTTCSAELIGKDECLCERCIDDMVSAAEYAHDSLGDR